MKCQLEPFPDLPIDFYNMLLFIKSALRGLQTETCYFNKSLYISHASLVEQDIIEYVSWPIQNSLLNF